MANIVVCVLLKIETNNISYNHFIENHPLEQHIETSQKGHLALQVLFSPPFPWTLQIKDSGVT